MNICVYGASSEDIDKGYIYSGESLGKLIAQRGHGLVFGGGSRGMMGAAARGAYSAGGEIIGVAPSFFHVDGVLFEHCSEMIETDTMRERKKRMEELSEAYVMTPGGMGTFDEFFEILTLKQLRVHSKPIAVLNALGYFDPLVSMLENAVSQGFMTVTAMTLFAVFDDVEKLMDYLETYTPPQGDAAHFKLIH